MVFIIVAFQKSLPQSFSISLALFYFAVEIPAGNKREAHAEALPADFAHDVSEKFIHGSKVGSHHHDAARTSAASA